MADDNFPEKVRNYVESLRQLAVKKGLKVPLKYRGDIASLPDELQAAQLVLNLVSVFLFDAEKMKTSERRSKKIKLENPDYSALSNYELERARDTYRMLYLRTRTQDDAGLKLEEKVYREAINPSK